MIMRLDLAQHAVLLPGTHNLRVHSHQVVVDGVLLLFLRFLRKKWVVSYIVDRWEWSGCGNGK